ncbi:hypothetical protein PPL_00793 [Heterostelium album PN500]|uniref:Uncharacterized protein n=1 Tax=Heterostelium pallidum (strain ATCC 26659 / Pp 5 / PN500) TaxID=670386 RepID=D3AXG2_HETP5|nr:hypothetical protein PPL_00793 [Heterostelium album PN500]EFA86231.1 hypothetical protein PPL_00793 [Heterostelium album PN500]|eukprot:XP_020438336.1 hypothetical protein PPL_00793 [Heterostelium album PN500]
MFNSLSIIDWNNVEYNSSSVGETCGSSGTAIDNLTISDSSSSKYLYFLIGPTLLIYKRSFIMINRLFTDEPKLIRVNRFEIIDGQWIYIKQYEYNSTHYYKKEIEFNINIEIPNSLISYINSILSNNIISKYNNNNNNNRNRIILNDEIVESWKVNVSFGSTVGSYTNGNGENNNSTGSIVLTGSHSRERTGAVEHGRSLADGFN